MKAAARVVLAVAALLGLGWITASLWFPLGWDQGIFAAVGDVVVRGGMPYRDGWDVKGPVVYYAFALAQWLLGRHLWSARVLEVILLLVGGVALARLVARLTAPRMGVFAAVICVLWYGSLGFRETLQPDAWVAMLMTVCVASLLGERARPTAWRLAGCGLLVGCSALIKPFYALFILLPLIYLYAQRDSEDRPMLGRAAVAALGAAALSAILVAAWFAYRGAFGELVRVHLLYSSQMYADAAAGSGWRRAGALLQYLWSAQAAVALPAIAAGAVALRRVSGGRATAGLLAAWAGIALVGVAIQRRFWYYHWIPVFPPAAALSALGLWHLANLRPAPQPGAPPRLLQRAGPGLVATLGGVMLLTAAVIPAREVRAWLSFVSGRSTATVYYTHFHGRDFAPLDDMQAAEYIRQRTGPGERVAIWGNNATITFLSGRPNPTRFVVTKELSKDWAPAIRDAYRREYLERLRSEPPVFIVVGMLYGASKEASLRGFPELATLLCTRYRFDARFGLLDLYRRAEEGEALGSAATESFCGGLK